MLSIRTPDLLTPRQLADELQVSAKTLANQRSRREGPPYVKVGGAVRYSRAAVAQWLAAQSRARRAGINPGMPAAAEPPTPPP